MGKKTRDEAGELLRPSQDGAGAPPSRRAGGEKQRETAACLERFANTPGRAASGKPRKLGGSLEPDDSSCDAALAVVVNQALIECLPPLLLLPWPVVRKTNLP